MKAIEKQICSRCIYDASVPAIVFDNDGVCNYCKMVDNLAAQYATGTVTGSKMLDEIIAKIKRKGKGKKYDCIVGVSGGTDSSYLLYWAVEQGLRPLAVHYDNTWNTAIATENIRKVLADLQIDLYTHVIDNKEADDIFLAFFKAGVPEIEASTDLALAETMYRAAYKYKVQYILEGHSFMTEGISPLGKNYFDGKYIQKIHQLYGSLKMHSYPLMTFWRFLFWTMFVRIRKIRPLWYLAYDKKSAQQFLMKKCDWKYYGGHHLENRMTAFFHSIYCPQKFHIDYRNNTLAALVRNGQLDRDEAIHQYYHEAPHAEPELVSYFKKRLQLLDEDYERLMGAEPKYWYQFQTYKKRFELLKPVFYLLMRSHLIPKSFYMKYCFPSANNIK